MAVEMVMGMEAIMEAITETAVAMEAMMITGTAMEVITATRIPDQDPGPTVEIPAIPDLTQRRQQLLSSPSLPPQE